jgi:hypothetical protein
LAATFSVSSGEIADEDIHFVIPTTTTCRRWYQTGAAAYAFVSGAGSAIPGYLGPNNRPYYVNSTGYVLTEMDGGAPTRFINTFVYATSDVSVPIYMFTETVSSATATANGYTTLALARAVPFPNLALVGISPELKPLYRLIWSNTGALQAIDVNQDDYRLVTSIPTAGGNVSTTAGAVSFSPAGTISSTTVQTAIQELDGDIVALDAEVSAWIGTLYVETVANQDYVLSYDMPFAGTITALRTKTQSGTCTVTGYIGATDLGGTANSASSSAESQAHASDNTFAVGNTVKITISANSAALSLEVTFSGVKS